ncbi:beta/gamma crystallin-related protein [Caulobacter sp. KR2-114]|uniref:beta/gamma crystallin-related protein n=1 Tax=Caulobacter sp. KR2-114 TaxID=3400912 RepID=UPI003BFF96AB
MKRLTALALAGLCAAFLAGSATSQPRERRAILYEYPHFQGRSYVVYGGNRGLGPTGFEDRAMSGRFDGPWTVCEDDDFQGHCETVSGDVGNFDRLGLGHEISSLHAVRGGGEDWRGGDGRGGDWRGEGWRGGGAGPYGDYGRPRGRTATLFEYPDFRGQSYTVYGENAGLGSTGFEDRAMSGYFDGPWVICEDDDYRGHCETVQGRVRDLGRMGLGHEVSSLHALRDR